MSELCNKKLIAFQRGQANTLTRFYDEYARELARWVRFNGNQKDLDNINKAMESYYRDKILIRGMNVGSAMANKCVDGTVDKYVKGVDINKKKKEAYAIRGATALKGFQHARRSGLDLSKRVWNLKDQNKELITTYLKSGIHKGVPASTIARDMKQLLVEPDNLFRRVKDPKTGKLKLSRPMRAYKSGKGVYRSSYKNALRLARNETNIAYRDFEYMRHQELDFILGVRINLSASHPEIDICDELQGLYPKQFRFIGWHPNCLCYRTTELMDKKDFVTAVRNDDFSNAKQVQDIPSRASRHIQEIAPKINAMENKPYFIVDNFEASPTGALTLAQTSLPPVPEIPNIPNPVNENKFVDHSGFDDRAETVFPVIDSVLAMGLERGSQSAKMQGALSDFIGFSKTPKIVNADAFKQVKSKTSSVTIFRGMRESIESANVVEQFKKGEMFHGVGVYGNGSYFTTKKSTAMAYADRKKDNIVEAIVDNGSMKTIEYRALSKEMHKARRQFDFDEATNKYMDKKYSGWRSWNQAEQLEKTSRVKRQYMELYNDEGAYATFKGYDAIEIQQFANESYYVVLNRTKLIIAE